MKTTYKEIREIEEINLLIEQGNATLKELGYTEHSKKHAAKVSDTAGKILTELGYGKHKIELARIAGARTAINNGTSYAKSCVNTLIVPTREYGDLEYHPARA